MSSKHEMHGILPLDYMRKQINALQTLVEVIMVRHITNLTSHDLIMKTVQNLFTHNLYVSHIDIMH
jgi:N-acetyl-anhydromuramyl-L-alanine amidase AmpD